LAGQEQARAGGERYEKELPSKPFKAKSPTVLQDLSSSKGVIECAFSLASFISISSK